ncbi:reverse transcriptase [Tanacetum coccineum]
MVNTRSNDTGLIPNPVPMETQIANLTSSLAQLTQMFQLESGLNNGKGPSQRRDTGGHNGVNTGGTYRRVNNFFDMDHIVEDEQKIRLVSMHMFGKALNWHQHFMIESGQMYSLEIVAYEDERNNNDCEIFEQENVCEEETMPQVSLNAMTGVPTHTSGLHAAKRMGCNLSRMCPLQVSVANGQVMSSVFECKNFKWTIHGQVFETDVIILPLGGCEMMTWSSTKPNSNIQNTLSGLSTVFDTPKELPPTRSHDHLIPLLPNTPPINVRPYEHPLNQKDAIELIVKEIIKNSQSSFSLPIVMVKRNDGTWRMCVDYRMLNKYTVKDKFSIPIIEELLDELHRAKVFSKLDLMNPDDIHKTAFRTHEGHYEFLVMPFGLTNAPSTFQSLMNTVFKPFLRKFVLPVKRSIWGHIITEKGVSTDPTKIQAMESCPIPQTVKQLRGFLGLTRYYKKFIKNYAWIMETDASGIGIGAVLQHEGHLIAYLSKTLAPKHQALSTYEKEFLAALMALDKWRGYLLDIHFKIKTDHFKLKYLLNQDVKLRLFKPSGCQNYLGLTMKFLITKVLKTL